ncbi:MAG: cbb3-type cytochrome c oxidase N-terminal domain-containing protein [Phycisphaerales bacterium JB038]
MANEKPERDVLFDHAYDGIMEYDNPMPGWWVWMFIGSIVFSFLYVLFFHVGIGPTIWDQLESAKAAHAAKLVADFGELEPTEEEINRQRFNDIAISSMGSLFKGKCAQCHAADGSGGVGPNLTDDAYINIKRLPDIARILNKGVVDKGMPAWEEQFSETQIVLMAAYVAHLRSTDPGQGKDAEGEVIDPWPEYVPEEPAEG